MINLSKYSQPILDCTPFDRNTCKSIGEFAGNDVHLKRGDLYYVLESGGHTFVKVKLDSNDFCSQLGENRHMHVYQVKRRTPCSYVTEYKHTQIICHSRNQQDVYIFTKCFENRKGPRRFFPNRRLDVQKYLTEYATMPFETIPNEVDIKYRGGDFQLDLQRGMIKYFPY